MLERHASNKPNMTAKNSMVFCLLDSFVTANGMSNAVNVTNELSNIRYRPTPNPVNDASYLIQYSTG